MKQILKDKNKAAVILQAFLIYTWLTVLSVLSVTDTYYTVYLLCGALGFLCLYDNYKSGRVCARRHRWVLLLCSCWFSSSVVLANYTLFEPLSVLQNLFDGACCFAGGLCVANALTALSGAMVGQYQKTMDINGGTGIVVIGLACLIIGETVLGRRSVRKGIAAVMVGSVIYRLIYAIVYYTKIVPVEGLKLLTAVIVALAIAAPSIKEWAAFQRRKAVAGRKGGR